MQAMNAHARRFMRSEFATAVSQSACTWTRLFSLLQGISQGIFEKVRIALHDFLPRVAKRSGGGPAKPGRGHLVATFNCPL
jgi:hypothetical protein